MNQKLSKGLNC